MASPLRASASLRLALFCAALCRVRLQLDWPSLHCSCPAILYFPSLLQLQVQCTHPVCVSVCLFVCVSVCLSVCPSQMGGLQNLQCIWNPLFACPSKFQITLLTKWIKSTLNEPAVVLHILLQRCSPCTFPFCTAAHLLAV